MSAFTFHGLMHPWLLLLLVGVAALFIAECAAGSPGALTVSTGEILAKIKSSGRRLFRYLPPLLRAAGLALLVVALARPLQGLTPRKDTADIVDIMLCVDVSESMQVSDLGGGNSNRLEVTKEAVRDFIYADDLADACIVLLDSYDALDPINVGSGSGVSIAEVAAAAKQVTGYRGAIRFDRTKPDGMPVKILETSRIQALGWEPRTPFPAALEATYAWYLKECDVRNRDGTQKREE